MIGWSEPVTRPHKKLLLGNYVRLSGDITWEQIQKAYDEVYEDAVACLHKRGQPEKVCMIKMIVKIRTLKHSLLGDIANGKDPSMTIGWRCEVDE